MLDEAKFDDKGLVLAIAQDAESGEVLMAAWMNREALGRTLDTGIMTYWSRSRGTLWVKGETSGHTQRVVEARIDCDGDVLLFKVRQEGGACHTGYRTCFYRKHTPAGLVEDGKRVFDPAAVYRR